MFKKILIANRGEIAVRIIVACRELEILSIAIFSESDQKSRHIELADEYWRLEGQPARAYLDIQQIIEIAKRAKAEAIHPGYGFLSENADFAQACLDAGIKFIGPSKEVIQKMGSKVEARRAMVLAEVPIVPGTTDPVTESERVKELGTEYGYPIAIKASAGGGGRGLRVAYKNEDVDIALSSAQREGMSYFGSNEVYVEKYLEEPRHIEVQILGDLYGNIIHLGERDCSSQRRHQKLIEETPAPNLSPSLRANILEAAVRGAKSLQYSSAGTLEFLVEKDRFYFLEVNTRVQVEHTITEMVTGVDIVKEQIRIACGEKLSLSQSDVVTRGHAIECRINAEDPNKNFLPSPGTIHTYAVPGLPWLRVDTACYAGYQVLPFYDSLLAKLIVWGANRDEAITRAKLALKSYKIEGVATSIPFLLALLSDGVFRQGKVNTKYVETRFMKQFLEQSKAAPISLPAPEFTAQNNGSESESIKASPSRKFEVEVNQKIYKVMVREVTESEEGVPKNSNIASSGKVKDVEPSLQSTKSRAGTVLSSSRTPLGARSKRALTGTDSLIQAPTQVRAFMPGLVKELLVKQGDRVERGQRLLIFEAMKMESDVVAERAGCVSSIDVKAGETVEVSRLLLVLGEPH